MIDAVATFLHIIGVIIWIGGMFYTLFAFRPSLTVLQENRLLLVETVMGRFFRFVWLAIVLLLITGGYRAHLHINSVLFDLKLLIYTVMVLIFSYIYFGLFKKLKKLPAEKKKEVVDRIVLLIRVNFGLGLLVIFLIEMYIKGV